MMVTERILADINIATVAANAVARYPFQPQILHQMILAAISAAQNKTLLAVAMVDKIMRTTIQAFCFHFPLLVKVDRKDKNQFKYITKKSDIPHAFIIFCKKISAGRYMFPTPL